jgi:uncharacterized protein YpmS
MILSLKNKSELNYWRKIYFPLLAVFENLISISFQTKQDHASAENHDKNKFEFDTIRK